MASKAEAYVGIDVSKSQWDAAVHGLAQTHSFPAGRPGLKRLLPWLRKLQPKLICLEATGVYHQRLVEALQQADFPVAVVNPRQVRDLARSCGQLAKTDLIDALMIARYAALNEPSPDEPLSENQRELKALEARRQQVAESRTQEKNRFESTLNRKTRALIRQAIDFYDKQLKALERQIKELVNNDAQFQQRAELLTSVPGIGPKTAAALQAQLPELRKLNRGQVAKLAGLAPLNRDSGTLRGRRMIGGGRASVRRALYMAALVAARHNPTIKKHYHQLLDKGKAKLVALTACMRKLLVTLNAMLKNNSPWNPSLNP
jgi:transposase